MDGEEDQIFGWDECALADERLIMQAAQRQPVVVKQQAHVTIKSIEPSVGMTISTITRGSTLFLRSRKAEGELYQLIRDNEDIPKEVSTLLSTLDAINDVNDDTVQQLQQQLVDMSRERDEQEELYKKEKEETRRWKSIACELRKKCRYLSDETDDDISSVDLGPDESDRCHSTSTKTEDTSASTISFLSSENGTPSDLVMRNEMKELQAENDALHESLEEAMQLAKGMKEIVSYFARVHKENPPIHSADKVRLLKEEVNVSKSKLLADLCDVMEDIHILRSSSDELDDTVSM